MLALILRLEDVELEGSLDLTGVKKVLDVSLIVEVTAGTDACNLYLQVRTTPISCTNLRPLIYHIPANKLQNGIVQFGTDL